MKLPAVGSIVKVRVRYNHGPLMIPPQPGFHEYEGKVLPPYKWLSDREFCMTGDAKWPIRVISTSLVEDMELLSGTMTDVNTDVEVFEVAGSKGNKYVVTKNSKGWSCTCPGATFRNTCKHITKLSGVTQ